MEARQAFADFEKVISYSGVNYKDVGNLKAQAEDLGTTYVLFALVNRSIPYLPPEAVANLTDVRPQSMNKRWVKYDSEPRRSSYQYEVTFSLDRSILYPIAVNTRRFVETKAITGGTEYKTDSKGKPVLDSNGNFIKIPKVVQLKCTITEVIQEKKIQLDGALTYYDVENRRTVRTVALTKTAVAYSSTFKTNGDLRALSDKTKNRITAPFVPLPNDELLLIWVSKDMGEQIQVALNDNAYLIK
jgi:hypothetical protein